MTQARAIRIGSQPRFVGGSGEAMSRKRRNDNIERVCRGSAVRRRVGQRVDYLELLNDRSRPTMSDDDRQRIRML